MEEDMGIGPSLFRTSKRIHTGVGCLINLSEEIQRISPSQILLVTDPAVEKTGAFGQVKALLEKGEFAFAQFDGIDREPTLETLERCLKWIGNHKFDAVIGLGGGSSLDVAKVAAIMLANGGSPQDYMGIEKIPQPGVPMVMIPTTAGTGAEVTPNALLIDKKEKVKKSFVSSYLVPEVAIVDPELTVTLPPELTASTGMDALAHCLESFISLRATPTTELISLEGIRRISGSLREAYTNGANIEARYNMSLGSLYGGIALTNAGTTAVHALAYPLGGRYGVSHGVSNAIMLPYVMKYNCLSNMGKFGQIAEAMGEDLYGLNQREAAFKAIDAIFQLARDVNIPLHLKDLKIGEEAIPEMAADAIKWGRLLTNNPRQMTRQDAAAIYFEAA
jgi:alcohol dehydrogenase